MDLGSKPEEPKLANSNEKIKPDKSNPSKPNQGQQPAEQPQINENFDKKIQEASPQVDASAVAKHVEQQKIDHSKNQGSKDEQLIQKSKPVPLDHKNNLSKIKPDNQLQSSPQPPQKLQTDQKKVDISPESKTHQTNAAEHKDQNSALSKPKMEQSQDNTNLVQKHPVKDTPVEKKLQIEQNLLKQKNVALEPCDNPAEPTQLIQEDYSIEQNKQANAQIQVGNQSKKQPQDAVQVADDEEEKEKESDGFDQGGEQIVERSPAGRFRRFGEEIGHGAYKKVFKAMDTETGREVAWSVINLSNLPKSERPRIKSEIKIIEKLKHQNIISFVNAWIDKESLQINLITELITGGSLRQYLARMGKPKLKVIKRWCHEVLEGLKYLHSKKIIHRDIKCDNIFINSNSGEIKIGDLGLSTAMMTTHTESVLGTPEFMAPELYEESYDTAVDIYAFGMALLEMLTREVPYRECSNPAQIYRKVSSSIHPESLDRVMDEQVKNFILWCLEEKSKRPTAEQLLNSEFMGDTKSENNNKPCRIAAAPKLQSQKSNIQADHPQIQSQDDDLPECDATQKDSTDQDSQKNNQPQQPKQANPQDIPSGNMTQQQHSQSQKQIQASENQVTRLNQQTLDQSNHKVIGDPEKQQDVKSNEKIDQQKLQSSPNRGRRVQNADCKVNIISVSENNQNNNQNRIENKDTVQATQKNQQKSNKVDENYQQVVDKSGQQNQQNVAEQNLKDAQDDRRKVTKQEKNAQKSQRAKNIDLDNNLVATSQNEKSVATNENPKQNVKHQGLYPVKKDFKEDVDSKTPNLLQRISNDPSSLGEQILSPRKQKTVKDNQKDQQNDTQQDLNQKIVSKQLNQQQPQNQKDDKSVVQPVEKQNTIQQQQSKVSAHKPKHAKQINDSQSAQKQQKQVDQKTNVEKRQSQQIVLTNDMNLKGSDNINPKILKKQESVDVNAIYQTSQQANLQNQQTHEKHLEESASKLSEMNKPLGTRPKRESYVNLTRQQQVQQQTYNHKESNNQQSQDQDFIGTNANQQKGNQTHSKTKKTTEHAIEINEAKKQQMKEPYSNELSKKQIPKDNQQPQNQIIQTIDGHGQNSMTTQQAHHVKSQIHGQINIGQGAQLNQTQLLHQNNIMQNSNHMVPNSNMTHVNQISHKQLEKVVEKVQHVPKQNVNQTITQQQNQSQKDILNQNNIQMTKFKSNITSHQRTQKQIQQSHHHKESEAIIPMRITVKGDEIRFDYKLKLDTPQTVAREYVLQRGLDNDKDVQEQFKNEIQKVLDEYYKNKKLQEQKILLEQQNANEYKQLQNQHSHLDKQNTKEAQKKHIQQQTTKPIKPQQSQQIGPIQPQDIQSINESTQSIQSAQISQKIPSTHNQQFDKQEKSNQEEIVKRQQQKPTQQSSKNINQQLAQPISNQNSQQVTKQNINVQQPIKNQEQKKNQQTQGQNQNQTATNSQNTGNQNAVNQNQSVPIPAHHTPEFLKKRDEYKKIYKEMNTGIMKFFKLIKNENMTIDQILDAMDYQEQKDREFKHKYIQRLMDIETEFLNTKKHNQHKTAQKGNQSNHTKDLNSHQKQSNQAQKNQINTSAQISKQQSQISQSKNNEKQVQQVHDQVNIRVEQSGQSNQKMNQGQAGKSNLSQSQQNVAQSQPQIVKKNSQQKQSQQQQIQTSVPTQIANHNHQNHINKSQNVSSQQNQQHTKNHHPVDVATQQNKPKQTQTNFILDAQVRINKIKKAIQKGRDIDSMIQNVGWNHPNHQQSNTQTNQISPTKNEPGSSNSHQNIGQAAQYNVNPIQVTGVDDQLFQEEVKRIQEKLQVDQDGVASKTLIQKMDHYIEKLNYKNDQREYQLNQIKKQPNQQSQKTVNQTNQDQSQQNMSNSQQKRNEEAKQIEKDKDSHQFQNKTQTQQNQQKQQTKVINQQNSSSNEKSSGLMTEISKPQQESAPKKEQKVNKFIDDSESKKDQKMEQGSSGTFNTSRAEDYDGYAPDDTMITHNSHETTIVEGSTKQVLAELIASDNIASGQQMAEQNGGSHTNDNNRTEALQNESNMIKETNQVPQLIKRADGQSQDEISAVSSIQQNKNKSGEPI